MSIAVMGIPDSVGHCPYCGGDVAWTNGNGANQCGECGKVFYVIEQEEVEDGQETDS